MQSSQIKRNNKYRSNFQFALDSIEKEEKYRLKREKRRIQMKQEILPELKSKIKENDLHHFEIAQAIS